MPPNKNVGYGRQVFDAFPPRTINGRALVVGASTLTGLESIMRTWLPDTFGRIRYFTTLAAAIAAAQANRDTIYVMPGHTETISSATALTISVAGVQIVGVGTGSLRPTFTLDTATTATINVTAANVRFENCVFVANFAAIASLFTLTTAAEFAAVNCEFRDTSAILNFVAIVTTAATSNAADGLTIKGSKRFGLGATTNTTIVSMLGTNDRVTLGGSVEADRNYFTHQAVTGGGLMIIATGKIVTNAIIRKNTCNFLGATSLTTGLLITTNGTTNTGVIAENEDFNLDATTEILVTAGSGFVFFNNYHSGAADKSGYLLPAADA